MTSRSTALLNKDNKNFVGDLRNIWFLVWHWTFVWELTARCHCRCWRLNTQCRAGCRGRRRRTRPQTASEIRTCTLRSRRSGQPEARHLRGDKEKKRLGREMLQLMKWYSEMLWYRCFSVSVTSALVIGQNKAPTWYQSSIFQWGYQNQNTSRLQITAFDKVKSALFLCNFS